MPDKSIVQHTHGRYSPVSSAENEHLLVPRVHDRPCRRVGIRYVNLDACLGVAGKICFDPVLCSALLPSLLVHCFCRTAPAGARFSGIARASPLSMAKNIGKKVRFVDNDAGGMCTTCPCVPPSCRWLWAFGVLTRCSCVVWSDGNCVVGRALTVFFSCFFFLCPWSDDRRRSGLPC